MGIQNREEVPQAQSRRAVSGQEPFTPVTSSLVIMVLQREKGRWAERRAVLWVKMWEPGK